MKPHPTLTNRYATPDERPSYVKELFDEGAAHYDPVVGWGFFGTGNLYRCDAMRRNGLRQGMRLIDVASGTGLMAMAAQRILKDEGAITCVEPSDGMIAQARQKLNATFLQSHAEAIPVPDESFDFLTVGYAMRHFEDLEKTFTEFRRVLKPGGRVLLLEATRPEGKTGSALFKFYFGQLYPFLTRVFTRNEKAEEMMVYFWETMDQCVRPEVILAALENAGFETVKRRRMLGIFSEYTATKQG